MVYVLLVDVNVDTKGLPVVQVFDIDDLFYIYKKNVPYQYQLIPATIEYEKDF